VPHRNPADPQADNPGAPVDIRAHQAAEADIRLAAVAADNRSGGAAVDSRPAEEAVDSPLAAEAVGSPLAAEADNHRAVAAGCFRGGFAVDQS
jgi:hypothetical protein